MPVTPATQEAEVGESQVQNQPVRAAGEMTLPRNVALMEEPGSVPRTYMKAYGHLQLQSKRI